MYLNYFNRKKLIEANEKIFKSINFTLNECPEN